MFTKKDAVQWYEVANMEIVPMHRNKPTHNPTNKLILSGATP
jgi:hypothetical protein